MLRYWLIGVVSAPLLSLASAPGDAAPALGTEGVKAALQQSSAVEKAVSRCWWQNGMRVCARSGAPVYGYNAPAAYGYYTAPPAAYGYYGAPVFYGYRPTGYGFYYGHPRPEYFPTGTTSWWRAMDYEGRGGHGRGF